MRGAPTEVAVEFFGGPWDGETKQVRRGVGAIILSTVVPPVLITPADRGLVDPKTFCPERIVDGYVGHYLFERGFKADSFVWSLREPAS